MVEIPTVKVDGRGVYINAFALTNSDDDYFRYTYTGAEVFPEKGEIHVFETVENYSGPRVEKRAVIYDYECNLKGYLVRETFDRY